MKAVPHKSCEQTSQEICVTPDCPLVVENKACEAVERSGVVWVPNESCQLMPQEVCTEIVKEYPSLMIDSDCQYLPRENCSPDNFKPKELTKPVIKKVLLGFSLF